MFLKKLHFVSLARILRVRKPSERWRYHASAYSLIKTSTIRLSVKMLKIRNFKLQNRNTRSIIRNWQPASKFNYPKLISIAR